jgi:hypothetical protein
MARSQARKPPVRTVKGALRLTLVLLVAVVVVGGVPLTARAALGFDGGGNVVGNGRHNRVALTINSPEFSHGIQHIGNENAGGGNNTQAALCKKKVRRCRISQRLFTDP